MGRYKLYDKIDVPKNSDTSCSNRSGRCQKLKLINIHLDLSLSLLNCLLGYNELQGPGNGEYCCQFSHLSDGNSISCYLSLLAVGAVKFDTASCLFAGLFIEDRTRIVWRTV